MTTTLIKGQNIPLEQDGQPLDAIRLTVGWGADDGVDVDVSALLLGPGGKVRDDTDFVFYNQPAAEDGAVRLLGKAEQDDLVVDRLLVSPPDLGDGVEKITILVSLDAAEGVGFGEVQELSLTVCTVDEQSLAVFEVRDLGVETAVVLGELYRRGEAWRFRAVGQGYASGLQGVATDYGITVDEETPAEDVPVEPKTNIPASQRAADSGSETAAATADEAVPADQALRAVRTRKRRTVIPVRPMTLGEDDSWKASRLFPVVGIGGAEEQEGRATSALLSVLMGVKEFGRAITGRVGAPAGVLETYLEVPFGLGESTVRPDGVLRIARAGRVWTALVEVKTGSGQLSKPQVEDYLTVAKERGYDAVITVSNELPASAGEHPVGVDRRKLRKVALHHLAWTEVLHEATMQLAHRGVSDPTQAWVLAELVRYLQHPRSGASGFEDMGAGWVTVRDAVASGTLRPSDRRAPEVATSWDRLIRQVCLRKTGELGSPVTSVGARSHRSDPAGRTAVLVRELVSEGRLTAGLRVPGAVGPVQVVADLRTSQVELSVDLAAPTTGRPTTRVNWLLRQLPEAPPGVRVDAFSTRSGQDRCEMLAVARGNPGLLVPAEGDAKSFRLSLVQPLGSKRGIGRGGFITSVQEAVDTFYRDVVQNLQPWSPAAPKLPAHDAAAEEDQPVASDDGTSFDTA